MGKENLNLKLAKQIIAVKDTANLVRISIGISAADADGVKVVLETILKGNTDRLTNVLALPLEQQKDVILEELVKNFNLNTKDLKGDKEIITLATLKDRTSFIINEATKLNQAVTDMSPQQITVFLGELQAQGHDVSMFQGLRATNKSLAAVTDLPLSVILTNLNKRVLEQKLFENSVDYPLMNLVNKQFVTNGIIDIFYTDYRDGDNTSGYSDVVIADYNKGIEKQFKETYLVDTNWHKGYDLMSDMLNDVTLTIGLYIALVKDYTMAITRPLNKFMYGRFAQFLDTTASYDAVKTFTATGATADDVKARAKELKLFLTSIATPSRSNLVRKPNGATEPLERAIATSNLNIIFNKKYDAEYRYDLLANTFNLDVITYSFKSVKILDFDKIKEYVPTGQGDSILADLDFILVEDGVYNEMIHYDGTKIVDTPKLKQVLNRYLRLGNYARKDRALYAFKRT